MSATAQGCPTEQELKVYNQTPNALTKEVREAMASHIAGCEACQENQPQKVGQLLTIRRIASRWLEKK